MAKATDSEELVIRPVETDEELRQANDLMAKIHFPDYFAGLQWLETCGAGYPGFLREHTRIALRNGELAGSLRLNTETIRLGEARLKTGGFGWVTTAPAHRHKGVACALINDSMQYMKDHGYHVSMLFGIPNFYHRFGYVTTLADYTIAIDATEASVASNIGFKVRQAKPGDIPALQRMHNLNDAGVACSLLRSTAHVTNKWERWPGPLRVITTEQGKVVAYFDAHRGKGELAITEIGVSDAAGQSKGPATPGPCTAHAPACGALLATCVQLAAEESVGNLRFHVPPAHPFARFLLQYASQHEMTLVRERGGMMAFVDLGETLESMIPEWECLLARSAAREYRTECTLYVDRVPYRIRANRGAVDVAAASGANKVSLTPFELMHLVTGYRHLADILATRRRVLAPEARALLTALFPKRDPYVWLFDRF